MSPFEFENRYQSLENRLVQWFSQKSWFFAAVFIIGTLYLILSYPLWTQLQPDWTRFFIIQDRHVGGIVLIYGFFVQLWLPEKARLPFFFIMMVLAWAIPCFLMGSFRPVILAPVGFVALNGWIGTRTLKTSLKRSAAALFVIFSFILTVWLIGKEAELSKDFRLFRYFWTLHLELLVFFFLGACFNSQSTPKILAFNPLQLLMPFPWPDSSAQAGTSDRRKVMVAGWLQIVRADLVIFLMILGIRYVPESSDGWGGLLHYLSFLVTISAAMGSVTGLMRIYGFQVPDATYFLCLAKSPLEIWQRGSTFMARFLFQFVYLPVWKRTRNQWIAAAVLALVVFFHLHLFHEFFLREMLRFIAPTLPIQAATWEQTFLVPILWTFTWGVWIVSFQFFLKFTRLLSTPRGAWMAILLTHLGSSQMIPLSKWLAQLVGLSLAP